MSIANFSFVLINQHCMNMELSVYFLDNFHNGVSESWLCTGTSMNNWRN